MASFGSHHTAIIQKAIDTGNHNQNPANHQSLASGNQFQIDVEHNQQNHPCTQSAGRRRKENISLKHLQEFSATLLHPNTLMELHILFLVFLNALVSSINDSECNPGIRTCTEDFPDCGSYGTLQSVTNQLLHLAPKCNTYMINTCICNVAGYNSNTCLPDVYGCTMCASKPSSLSELDNSPPIYPGYIESYVYMYYCMNEMYPYSSFTTEIRGIGIHHPPSWESTTVNLRLCSGSRDLTKPIILLLSSYDATQWIISSNDTYVINNIQIDSIVALSYYHENTSVEVHSNIAINDDDIHILYPYSSPWNGGYGYGDDEGGGNTAKMIYQTPIILGDYLYSFIGTYQTNTIDACVGNQGVNASNKVAINTPSYQTTNINCTDFNVICSDLTVDINKDLSLSLLCNAYKDDECENIIINGNYANEISITCSDCSNIYIYGEFVRNINIICIVCDGLYIDAEYAQNIDIYCNECSDMIILATFIAEYIHFESIASNNISIYGEEASEIKIDAQHTAAFANSLIYAQNATRLFVSCYGSFYSRNPPCFNTDIYISSNIKSNSLICEYGCDGINLFFQDEIDVNLFENITFNECSRCPELNACGDIWRIYYNDYNESIIYNRSIDAREDDELWILYNYLRDNYGCTSSGTINCADFNVICSDLTVYVKKDMSLYLLCNGFKDDECENMENIIINANYANEIGIQCPYCSNIFIYGEFVRNININCTFCDRMYIDAEYAQNIDIYCNECNDMIIYGEEATDIKIDAQGTAAFTNSLIYAQNATRLFVSCYDWFYSTNPSCFNTDIYISSNIESNSLICKYGCDGINLFFEHEIDINLFETITFNECNGCPELNVCGDIWRIYYNDYNESIIYNRSIDAREDDELWVLYNYLRENYDACASYENILFNESYAMYNIIISTIFGIFFMMLLLIVIKDLMKKIQKYYKKMKYPMSHFISNKPSLCVLQYSIPADVVIFLGIIWWLIKITILFDRIKTYCAAKYSDTFDDVFCDEDIWCDTKFNYTHNSHYNKFNYKCVSADPIKGIMISFWFFATFLTALTMAYFFNHLLCNDMLIFTKRPFSKYIDENIVNVCDCFVCLCNRYERIKNSEHYNERTLWISDAHMSRSYHCCNPDACTVVGYLLIHFFRYGIYVSLTWITVIYYGGLKSDFVIRWYEFYPILILLMIKMILQMCYTFAPKYDESDEYFRGLPVIHELLNDVFGFDIGNIIFSYLSTRDEQSIELTTITQPLKSHYYF